MKPIASVYDVALRDEEGPRLEEYDVLVRGNEWIALSSQEAIAVGLLIERLGRVVGRDRLAAALWPQGCGQASLNQLMARVRRRVEPLGLEIATVRARGYVLRFRKTPATEVF